MIFVIVLILLILSFLGATGYSWLQLRKSMKGHIPAGDETPEKYQLPFEKVSFVTQDNVTLAGWYIPTPKPKAVVILIHGRGKHVGGKSSLVEHALYLYENNYATLLFDMRGYGASSGEWRGFGEKEWQDAHAAYQYVTLRPENKDRKIGFLGISLGGVVAIIVAGKEKIGDFLIASVPFAIHASLFARQVEKSGLFPKFFFRWALNTAAILTLGWDYFLFTADRFIAEVTSPILLIGAKQDTEVNPKDAWQLFEKANKAKDFWEADAPHDIFSQKKEEWLERVLRFLQVYVER